MRYTDEGNLRFVGNTRTSTSTQGVYRQEFDSGKWAVTLTNAEPGLGYLGYNVEALSYDFENNMLCTSGRVTLGQVPGESAIYDACGNVVFCSGNGHIDIRGNFYPTDPEYDYEDDSIICMGGGDLCIRTSYTDENREVIVDKGCIRLHYDDDNGWAGLDICPDRCEARLSVSRCAGSNPFIFCDNGTFKTSASDLLLENDVVVDDLYSATDHTCHYLYGIKKNGIDNFTSTGILDIGTVGSAVNVNGSNYVAGDNGLISLPNMATSVTLNNITTPVDSTGNINLGTFTATVDLNSNNSLLITNCTFSCNPIQSVALGYNSNITGFVPSGNVVIGKDSLVEGSCGIAVGPGSSAGSFAVSVGCGTDSSGLTVALGIRAKACGSGNIAIGRDVIMCSDIGKIVGIVQGSRLYTSNTYSNFGSLQLAIKCDTLECDLYNTLESIILNNIDNVFASERQNKDYLLLDKAIYRCGTDLQILGVGDNNTLIKYSCTSIDVGTRMTLHKNCTSPIVLCCPGSANYEVWNILY